MVSKIYLTEKEAVLRYAMSRAWFQRSRWAGNGPPFIKVNGSGRVLYPIDSTDKWFEGFAQKNTSI